MKNNEEEIVVGGQVISDVRFADDQGMVASSETGLLNLTDKLNDTARNIIIKLVLEKGNGRVQRLCCS